MSELIDLKGSHRWWDSEWLVCGLNDRHMRTAPSAMNSAVRCDMFRQSNRAERGTGVTTERMLNRSLEN